MLLGNEVAVTQTMYIVLSFPLLLLISFALMTL